MDSGSRAVETDNQACLGSNVWMAVTQPLAKGPVERITSLRGESPPTWEEIHCSGDESVVIDVELKESRVEYRASTPEVICVGDQALENGVTRIGFCGHLAGFNDFPIAGSYS
jgi:hypothetical protein